MDIPIELRYQKLNLRLRSYYALDLDQQKQIARFLPSVARAVTQHEESHPLPEPALALFSPVRETEQKELGKTVGRTYEHAEHGFTWFQGSEVLIVAVASAPVTAAKAPLRLVSRMLKPRYWPTGTGELIAGFIRSVTQVQLAMTFRLACGHDEIDNVAIVARVLGLGDEGHPLGAHLARGRRRGDASVGPVAIGKTFRFDASFVTAVRFGKKTPWDLRLQLEAPANRDNRVLSMVVGLETREEVALSGDDLEETLAEETWVEAVETFERIERDIIEAAAGGEIVSE